MRGHDLTLSCSKPTVWDGDLLTVSDAEIKQTSRSKPTGWDGDKEMSIVSSNHLSSMF